MNRGGVGARSLNIELQAALNPAGDRKIERFGWTFAPGDKVMQIENDYDKEVYNGDIGYIDDVDANAGEVIASFDNRSVNVWFWRTRHVGARLCCDHSQEPGLRISGRGDPGFDPALRHAAARSSLHRRHTRQAPGRFGRTKESGGHRSTQRIGASSLVEAQRVATSKTATTVWHGELIKGRRGLSEGPANTEVARWSRASLDTAHLRQFAGASAGAVGHSDRNSDCQ